MKTVLLLCLATALMATAAKPTEIAPLSGPYALRLTTNRTSAAPGEIVEVTAEFENTGSDVLWVPPRSHLCFDYALSESSSTESFPPYCNWAISKKLRPGKKLTYLIGFVAPPEPRGEIKLYLTINRAVTVPLLIRAPGAAAPPVATAPPTPL